MKSILRLVTLKPAILVRLFADAVLVNIAMLVALVGRYVYVTVFESASFQTVPTFWEYAAFYRDSVWAFTPLVLGILYLHGAYTFGRSYRKAAKILLLIRAVSIAFLVFGFGSYLLAGALYFPRAALVVAWALTTTLLVLARVWTWVWLVSAGYAVDPRATKHEQISRVLVIGGAGYIGSEVVKILLARGYTVRVLDMLLYGLEPLDGAIHHHNLELVQEDFRKVDRVVETMRGVDAVVHLGAIVGDPACALDEDLTIQVNLTATKMIAEVAKGVGVNRFIFASTCSVYGASDEILDEQSVLNPVSLYAKSKIASEQVLKSLADSRFAPVILRFGTIYGLSGRTRFDLVANLMSATAVFEGRVTVFGGDQWRPFVHVKDAARAVVECLEAPLAVVGNRALNVGTDEQNYMLRQVADLVAAAVPRATVVELGANSDRRNYRVSFAAIRSATGFHAEWTLRDGINQILDAIARGDIRDYRAPHYSNVQFLSEEGLLRLGREDHDWERELIRRSASLGGSRLAASSTEPPG